MPIETQKHHRLTTPKGVNVDDFLLRLRSSPWVEYAELDGVLTAATTVPNDPDFPLQWHHQNLAFPARAIPPDIRSVLAWDITRGSTNVTVAVLDTGVNTNLDEFRDRLVPGYDFVNQTTTPLDDSGHGTEMAAILCANANNLQFGAGVDWNCRLMPIKVLKSDNSGLYSTLADGVDWAVAHGANVITVSAGGADLNITLSNSVARAVAAGVVFVAAVHNDGASIRFPANLPMSIAVGASTQDDRRASFSNFGPELSLLAPGTNIYTMTRFGTQTKIWGTSASAPMVAGVASLIVSLRPDLSPMQVKTLLCAGADDQVGSTTEDKPGFDIYSGFGRLNALASVVLTQTQLETTPTNGTILLRWSCPSNASTKRPYVIQFASGPAQPWTTLAPTNIVFSPSGASWLDDGTQTGSLPSLTPQRIYRVLIPAP